MVNAHKLRSAGMEEITLPAGGDVIYLDDYFSGLIPFDYIMIELRNSASTADFPLGYTMVPIGLNVDAALTEKYHAAKHRDVIHIYNKSTMERFGAFSLDASNDGVMVITTFVYE
jgi:hypothetical protein